MARTAALLAVGLLALAAPSAALANTTAHPLASSSFSQDWSNTGLITANDDWSNVPSIVGYRGDALTAGTDPRAVTQDDTSPVVDVNANQATPNTFATGGVTEFELTDPTIALQGSGTADAPYIVVHLNTTGTSNVQFSFQARDLDTTDNTTEPLDVQYRVGSSGTWTSVQGGYLADATQSDATLATPVSVVLPDATDDKPLVQVRVITINAAGNDENVGIDRITAARSTLTTVKPAKLNGWSYDTVGAGTAGFEGGPGGPPLGIGSAEVTATSGVGYFSNSSLGAASPADLTTLAYSTFVTSAAPAPPAAAPYLSLSVDYNNDNGADDILYFEPRYQDGDNPALPNQGTPAIGAWQRWDAAGGGWWSENSKNGATRDSGVKTLTQITAGVPNPRVLSVFVVADGQNAPNLDANFDFVSIGVGSGTVTNYDFEPPNDVVVEGTDGADTIRICATGEDDGYYLVNGVKTSFTDADSITVNAGDDVDTVTIDNGAAVNLECADRAVVNPAGLLAPSGGITINGEGGSPNAVENLNGSATSGSASLAAISHPKTGQTTQSVTLTSVTELYDTIAEASFEAGLGSGSNTHLVDNGPTAGDGRVGVTTISVGRIEFGSKTAAEVDAGSGTDNVNVGAVSDTAVSDRLTIDTGGSSGEAIDFTGAIDLSGRDIRLLAAAGAITDNHIGNDVTAGKLGASAGSIGSGSAIDTAVANMEATATGADGLNFDNTGAVTIGDVSADLRGLHASAGPVKLTNIGSVNLGDDAPSTLSTAIVEGQTVSLSATSANADITTDSNRGSASAASTLSLSATRDILLGGIGRENDVISTGGGVIVGAGRDFSAGYGTDVVSESGTAVTAGRNLTVDDGGTGAGATVRTNTTTAGAPLTMTAGAGATMTLGSSSTNRAVVSRSTGEVLLSADHLVVEGDSGVNAATAPVRVRPATTGNDVLVGPATDASATAVELSSAELDRFSASALRIGRTDDNGLLVNVTSAIAPAGTSTLALLGGNVIQSAAISETNLRVVGTDQGFTLDSSGNDFVTFAGSAPGAGAVAFVTDSTAINIGTVDGLSGLTSGQDARITAAGAVTQTASVAAKGLMLAGAGPFTLNTATNAIERLAGSTTGTIHVTSNGALEIGQVGAMNGITTSDDSITIAASQGDLRVSRNVSTGSAPALLIATGSNRLLSFENSAGVSSSIISLSADRMALAGGTLAGTVGVNVKPDSAGRTVELGPAGDGPTALQLSDAELDKVTSQLLQIRHSGAIEVTAPVAPASVETLLLAATTFTHTGGGSLTESDLQLESTGAGVAFWEVKPGGVGFGGLPIPYTADKLTVIGGPDADHFAVEPSTTTEYVIDGNDPSGASGDTLAYDALGGSVSGDLTAPDGHIDRAGRERVNFREIETVSVSNQDADGDGVDNDADNCASLANPDQANADGDALGNACDGDDDNDGVSDADEQALGTDPFKADTDADGKLDPSDNCALVANTDQLDIDNDGAGDACDTDDDGDEDLDSADNCPHDANADQRNTDGAGDGGDACDADDDGDGHSDGDDNCPTTSNPGLVDHDRDGIGTACDNDLAPGACANHQAGGSGADTLTGTEAGDRITGLAGDDLINGLAGDDCLYGQDGDDRLAGDGGADLLKGHAGADRLNGGDGDDRLSGGTGDDRLTGGGGKNTYAAHSGNDRVSARNGVAETINCGSGRDRATVDADDTVVGCERVSRP